LTNIFQTLATNEVSAETSIRFTLPLFYKALHKRISATGDATAACVQHSVTDQIQNLPAFKRKPRLFIKEVISADGRDLSVQLLVNISSQLDREYTK